MTSSVLTISGGTSAIIGSGCTIQVKEASGSQNGYVTSTMYNTWNGKQNALTIGNLSETTSSVLTISGGSSSIIGSGCTIQVKEASGSQNGYLKSTDWSTFNGKQNSLTIGNLSETTSSVLTITGGSSSIIGSGCSIQVKQAGSGQSGYLSNTDWSTFNSKFDLPSGITFSSSSLSSSGTFSITATTVNTPTLQTTANMTIKTTGSGNSINIETDSDTGIINIGNTDYTTKTINIGNYHNGTVNIVGALHFTGSSFQVDGSAIYCNDIYSNGDNTKYFGSGSNRWAAIYGVLVDTSTLNTSTINKTSGDLEIKNTISGNIKFSPITSVILNTSLLDVQTDNTTDFGTSLKYIKNIYGNNYYANNIYGKTTNNLNVLCNLLPTTNTYTLGSSSNVFSAGYLTTLHIGNGTTSYDLDIQTTNENCTTTNYCAKSSGNRYAYIKNGCNSGGEIMMLSNYYGSTLYGITTATSGISSLYGDMVLAANATSQVEYIRLGKISSTSYIQCNQHTIPKVTATYDLGSASYYWLTGYITTLHSTTINATTINKTSGDLQIKNTTSGKIDVNAKDNLTLTSEYNGSDAIYIHSNGGTSQKIRIHAENGTSNDAIKLQSDAGGITLTAGSGKVITSSSHIIPSATTTHDLGSSSYIWNNGYISTVNTSTVNKTSGDLTLQNTTSGNIILAPFTNVNSKSILPSTTTTYNLGSSSYYWNNLYVDTSYTKYLYPSSGGSYVTTKSIYPATNETYNIGESESNRFWSIFSYGGIFNLCAAYTWQTLSDKRDKENIQSLDKGIEFIKKIEPVKYTLKNSKKNGYGVIAQDIKEHDDEEVLVQQPTQQFDHYSVNYTAMIPILIKAIQEQQKKIEELEKKINILSA